MTDEPISYFANYCHTLFNQHPMDWFIVANRPTSFKRCDHNCTSASPPRPLDRPKIDTSYSTLSHGPTIQNPTTRARAAHTQHARTSNSSQVLEPHPVGGGGSQFVVSCLRAHLELSRPEGEAATPLYRYLLTTN